MLCVSGFFDRVFRSGLKPVLIGPIRPGVQNKIAIAGNLAGNWGCKSRTYFRKAQLLSAMLRGHSLRRIDLAQLIAAARLRSSRNCAKPTGDSRLTFGTQFLPVARALTGFRILPPPNACLQLATSTPNASFVFSALRQAIGTTEISQLI